MVECSIRTPDIDIDIHTSIIVTDIHTSDIDISANSRTWHQESSPCIS